MGVRAISATSVLLPVGGQWLIDVAVTGLDGVPVTVTPSVVVTLPSGTTATPTVETVAAGRYRAAYTAATAGRYIARVTGAGDVADFAAHALAVTPGSGMPDAADVVEYLGATSHTLEEVQSAVDAEAAAQRAVCRIRAVYPPDLAEALKRRVARNLEMRKMPLAVLQGDAEVGSTVLPGSDPEVRRLEAPYRPVVFG
ncbi:hypothetical protein ABZ807_09455 [Micromonospora sp. NPDC047548]|uniref:hypothetical protein n=1 Tax=Micromonospora sp. NPDC047548 TaxID=3155624 RepID=UPI0033DAA1C8